MVICYIETSSKQDDLFISINGEISTWSKICFYVRSWRVLDNHRFYYEFALLVWGGGSLLKQIACFPVCALNYAFSFNRNDLYTYILFITL